MLFKSLKIVHLYFNLMKVFKRLKSIRTEFKETYSITFPRKKALVEINRNKRTATALQCTNSVFCNRFRREIDECPQYCEVIAEIKKVIFRGRQPRALVQKIEAEEQLNQESLCIKNMTTSLVKVIP